MPAHVLARGRADPPPPHRIVQKSESGLAEGTQIEGILEQDAGLAVDDLVLDPADGAFSC